MNSPLLQLLVLAGIAVFLFIRLKNVLGTKDGFEKPPEAELPAPTSVRRDFEVIEGGPDRDITDHVPEGSPSAIALREMKRIDSSFEVAEFLSGARSAYEMILMAFERGELEDIQSFLSADVFETFESVGQCMESCLPICWSAKVGTEDSLIITAVDLEDHAINQEHDKGVLMSTHVLTSYS